MENKFIPFSKSIINIQENGVRVEVFGFYDRGTRAVARGYIYFGEDRLDFLWGMDISEARSHLNV